MITVDARGDQCPIPVVKTKQAISELKGSGIVEVLVDNDIAVQNVTRLAEHEGAAVKAEKQGEATYRLEIVISREASGNASAEPTEAAVCYQDRQDDFIVVVSSECMGTGNDELGAVLIKGFLFAVSQLETLPAKIIFYNGGARLTTEGSASLEDLRRMEAAGVEILTCGTCLDYYHLKDKLAVGGVTNMYAIVEAMTEAGRILRP